MYTVLKGCTQYSRGMYTVLKGCTALRTFSKNHYVWPSFSQLFIFLSLTPRSVSLRGVTYFANFSAKTDLKKTHILTCLPGDQMGSLHKGKKFDKKSRDTATLKDQCHENSMIFYHIRRYFIS